MGGGKIQSMTVNGWNYHTFERFSDPSEFGQFASLVSLWRSKWKGDDLPAWRDFDFHDFKDWYGWLLVEDVIPDGGGDVLFRLWRESWKLSPSR